MKYRKCLWILLGAGVVLLAGCSGLGRPVSDARPSELPDTVKLYYFYENLCHLCDEPGKYYAMLNEELPVEERDRYPHDFPIYNVYDTFSRGEYERITDSMGISRDTLTLPVLIAGGRVFQGFETITANIREAYLTAAEDIFVNGRVYNPAERKTGDRLFEDYPVRADHLNIVYFYRITCPECAKTRPFIDQLPAAVEVEGRDVPLDITRINTRSANNGERIAAFFEAYGVPDADRVVPIVFLADSYLAGVEAISENLEARLRQRPGVDRIAGLLPAGN